MDKSTGLALRECWFISNELNKGRDILRESPEMKYVFIEKFQAEFSIKAMCRVLQVARSDWYSQCHQW
ncbi:hypothetical protein FSI99_023215 [Escherichia coli]|nr:hypothetical protein [Escherichia coli]EFD4923301.1 hypothetical protein [Escherichia coli]EFU9520509.1 hypothetical protein [Escherichia coli]EHR9044463.1 hypothetical protein [Escherichia coli]EKC6277671.1 hypothetical protein [Escherichia coli]